MTYPEHEKLAKVKDQSQAIGEFLDWASEQGWHLAQWGKDEWERSDLIPIGLTIQKVLASYFDIDLDRLEDEKRAMLEEMRASHEAGSPPGR